MPIHSVDLTPELESLVLAKVESGRYESPGDVICAALRTLDREERDYAARLAVLRDAIDDGDASGAAEGNPFDRVRRSLNIADIPETQNR